jgi:1-pyrroline-5-carboxylate dehydrogenase
MNYKANRSSKTIDFLKMFPALAETLYKNQPPFNAPNVWK